MSDLGKEYLEAKHKMSDLEKEHLEAMLSHVFGIGSPPPSPFPDCGTDETPTPIDKDEMEDLGKEYLEAKYKMRDLGKEHLEAKDEMEDLGKEYLKAKNKMEDLAKEYLEAENKMEDLIIAIYRSHKYEVQYLPDDWKYDRNASDPRVYFVNKETGERFKR